MNDKLIHIAIVEDNLDLCDELQFQLNSDTMNVVTMGNAQSLDAHLSEHLCDIVILDIGLPGEDGLSIADRLRQTHPEIGIIILTARSELDTRLDSLQRGADIHLVKPINWRELQAQIYALSRRINQKYNPETSSIWILKPAGRELITPSGKSINLTHMEGQVMVILTENSEQAVNRQTLINGIASEDPHTFDPRRLEVCISRLRQKIVEALKTNSTETTDNILPLKTVRSVGYVFTQAITFEKRAS